MSMMQAVIFALLALLLWVGSFYLMKFLIGFVCMPWIGWPSRWVTDGGAGVGCLILAFEGFRRQKRFLDLEEYTGSFHHEGFTGTETEFAARWMANRPLGIAYLISQFLFCAPSTTAKAIAAIRSRTRFGGQELSLGQLLLENLVGQKWRPISEYQEYAAVIPKLAAIEAILVRQKESSEQIRFNDDKLNPYGNVGPGGDSNMGQQVLVFLTASIGIVASIFAIHWFGRPGTAVPLLFFFLIYKILTD